MKRVLSIFCETLYFPSKIGRRIDDIIFASSEDYIIRMRIKKIINHRSSGNKTKTNQDGEQKRRWFDELCSSNCYFMWDHKKGTEKSENLQKLQYKPFQKEYVFLYPLYYYSFSQFSHISLHLLLSGCACAVCCEGFLQCNIPFFCLIEITSLAPKLQTDVANKHYLLFLHYFYQLKQSA